jgi:hypothetical protein
MLPAAEGVLRALCFHDAWGYAPTEAELIAGTDVGETGIPVTRTEAWAALGDLVSAGRVRRERGRITLAGRESLVALHEEREALFPKKWRAAYRVARWLRRLEGVRFVALCNTTALLHGRSESDLDFFVVAKAGTVWQVRAWGALPYALSRRRPSETGAVPDAVCLSFFVDDAALDLSRFLLPNGDPYFRYWYASLLPLVDDGVSRDLWYANASWFLRHHPLAEPWVPGMALPSSRFSLPMPSALEGVARRLQERAFSPAIRGAMNRDSRVVVDAHVLKFHVEDGRESFREAFRKTCTVYGVAS